MAQELESALGGVYSVLSQEFQLPLVNILLDKTTKAKKMPKLKEVVKPRSLQVLKLLVVDRILTSYLSFYTLCPLGPEAIMSNLNLDDYIDRLGASLGIDTSGLIKTAEQKQAEQQAQMESNSRQMQQQLMEMLLKVQHLLWQKVCQNLHEKILNGSGDD